MKVHMRLFGRASAFFEVAGRTSGRNIFPSRAPSLCARDDMVERKVFACAAILALETVTQKQVETGEGGVLGRPDIMFERDDRGQVQPRGGTSHLPFVMANNIDAVEKHRLDRRLPWPQGKRVIAERRIVGIEHQRRARVRMADKVGMIHGRSRPLLSPESLADQCDMCMTAFTLCWGQEGK